MSIVNQRSTSGLGKECSFLSKLPEVWIQVVEEALASVAAANLVCAFGIVLDPSHAVVIANHLLEIAMGQARSAHV